MVEKLFSLALWAAALGHFILPAAGLQIPYRFHWKNDLAKLHPFNRKLMWVYLFFITFVILAFGTLTLAFHEMFLRGDPLALGLATFIGLFWLARVLVDFFYFDSREWPVGNYFVLGHVLLITLDSFLCLTYLGLVVWRTLDGP